MSDGTLNLIVGGIQALLAALTYLKIDLRYFKKRSFPYSNRDILAAVFCMGACSLSFYGAYTLTHKIIIVTDPLVAWGGSPTKLMFDVNATGIPAAVKKGKSVIAIARVKDSTIDTKNDIAIEKSEIFSLDGRDSLHIELKPSQRFVPRMQKLQESIVEFYIGIIPSGWRADQIGTLGDLERIPEALIVSKGTTFDIPRSSPALQEETPPLQ